MKGRNAQVARLICTLNLLNRAGASGLSVRGLAESLRDRGHVVSNRTVYRDLEALGQAGLPVFPAGTTEDGTALWAFEKAPKISSVVPFSSQELDALRKAKDILKRDGAEDLSQLLFLTLRKIEDYSSSCPTHSRATGLQ